MLNNNTIANNQCNYTGTSATAAGLLVWSGSSVTGTNNILYGNSSQNNPNYSGNASLTYTCTTPNMGGVGNISSDPLFVNPTTGNFTLMSNSPCIDTGNPGAPLDPDGTPADMGYKYFDQNFTANITVTLTPVGMPIVIPANGGDFDFNIDIGNLENTAVGFSVWTTATLPSGGEYGPIINAALNLAGGVSVDRDRIQAVPATAPAGDYTYNAYVGFYPGVIWDEDHFDFSKSAVDNGGTGIFEWSNSGDCFGDEETVETPGILADFAIISAYPNPFNPETTISFTLNEETRMKLSVYDVQGREIALLEDGFRNAGTHERGFHAEGLPSGVYFARLQAGSNIYTTKLLLVK